MMQKRRMKRPRKRSAKKKKSGAVSKSVKTYVERAIKKRANHQMYPETVDYVLLNQFNERQFGLNIAKGDDKNRRLGDQVTLNGLRLEYEIQHLTLNATFTTPIYCKMFLVYTKRTEPLGPIWFKNDNDTAVLDFNTLATARVSALLKQKLNTSQFQIIGSKSMRIVPRNTNLTGSFGHFGKHYFKIKPTTVTWFDPSNTRPYPKNAVRPQISLVTYFIAPDTLAPESAPSFSAKFSYKWYYTD